MNSLPPPPSQTPQQQQQQQQQNEGQVALCQSMDSVNTLPGEEEFDKYKFGHAFSTSLAMPRDELAGFRSEATEFS
ncbi:hypothetical protein M8J77_004649 [Diaphorina citri]|nr:hypothetical protein M8J77_004649 [Diaphorina citri]